MNYEFVELPTDSLEYEILYEAAKAIKDVPGLTCELGVRRGGGSRLIIEGLMDNSDHGRTHICVDPYGNIDYPEGDDGRVIKCDYTNQMRNDCLKNIYAYIRHKPIGVLFYVMEDTEFFKRFADGVPVYNEHKQIVNTYALVHFDGPHTRDILYPEIDFFQERAVPGSMWVFDDVELYDHDSVEKYVLERGWELVKKGQRKASYVKK